MTSNSARRTAAPTTMTTPVSIGLWSPRRDVCCARRAALYAVPLGRAEVVS